MDTMEFQAKRISELTQFLEKHQENETDLLSFVFGMEVMPEVRILWMKNNWTISLYASIIYIIFVYMGQEVMKNRRPMNLKVAMVIWNFVLAAMSIWICYITLPEFYSLLNLHGFHAMTCEHIAPSKYTYYCAWLFALSKIFELGDTAFLILRKRPVILLHWYHHATVLVFTWYCGANEVPICGWFGVVNCVVHSFMYTYFTLTALGFKIPRNVAKMITIIQLSQMVVGFLLSVYAGKMIMKGIPCYIPSHLLHCGIIIYVSYFILFAQFFYQSYMTNERNKRKVK